MDGLVKVSAVVDGQGRLAPVRVKRRTGQQRMRASSCFVWTDEELGK